MDSPESAKPGAAFPAADAEADAAAPSPSSSPAVVQDSPFFTYVSNLSPIKTVNDGCAPSAFRELNFPSPSPVFTSPHANPIRRGNLLKRCQYLSPDSGKFTLKYAGNIKKISENMSLFGSNSCLLRNASVPCTMKDSECEFSTQLQSCSSTSGCVDEFLADPIEDSIDSCGPSNLCSDQAVQLPEHSGCGYATDSAHTSAHDLLQDAETGNNISKKTASELNPDNKSMKAGRSKARERLGEEAPVKDNLATNITNEDCMIDERSIGERSEPQFHRTNDLMEVDKHEENLADLSGYQNSLDQNTNDESYMVPMSREGDTQGQSEEIINFPLDHSGYVMQHSTKNMKGLKLGHTPNMQTESGKVVHLDNNQHDICEASCNTSAENVISCGRGGFSSKLRSEGCEYQRAMCKRLQFDSGPSNLESLNASHAEAAKITESSQSVTLSRHATSRTSSHLNQKSQAHTEIGRSIRKNRSALVSTVPRPSGIGLHLNSVVNVVAMNVHIIGQSEMDLEKDNLGAHGEIELGCRSRQRIISDSKICLASLSSTEDVSAQFGIDSQSMVNVCGDSGNDQQGNQAMAILSSSSGHLSHGSANSLKDTVQSEFLDCCTVPCNVKLPSVEDACESEELSESSPRKKRKKASEDGGCKRCNCKKSKCLKLYCDCFAAGVYCADACACQGCLNRPEYEDTVLETRQHIENRNPLAFAPKVVVRTAEVTQTSVKDSKGINPTSARHKRGCNCKRSQCLKKYCECFQAKVGCSYGCRCEGCKNSFGKKDDVEAVETEHVKNKDERCKNDSSDCTGVADSKGVKLNDHKLLRHISPFTPLQACYNGGNVSKTHYAARRYLSSPESFAAAHIFHGKSQGSSTNSGDTNRFLKVRDGKSGQCLSRKELEVHDADEVDLSSPKWERLAQRCNLKLLSSSSPSEPMERRLCLRAPISQGSGRVSVGSLVWHNSPITPMPHFGESRLSLESCSDNEPLITHEDDTPDILKDACMPSHALKMSSPNKKRVSPPHKQVHETRTNSSTSMRSRKFILKSVPSFPSLTPYGNNMAGHGT